MKISIFNFQFSVKRFAIGAAFFTLHSSLFAPLASAQPAIPRDAALEAKVEKTLARMTLDEKIGQMLELNLDVMGKMTVENAQVDREKVRSVLLQ